MRTRVDVDDDVEILHRQVEAHTGALTFRDAKLLGPGVHDIAFTTTTTRSLCVRAYVRACSMVRETHGGGVCSLQFGNIIHICYARFEDALNAMREH